MIRLAPAMSWGAAFCVLLFLSDCTSCARQPAKDTLVTEGASCALDDECETGLCDVVPGTNARVCVRKCTSGCKESDQCTKLAAARYGCVPQRAGLCQSCMKDSDCPYPADKCITLGNDRFCGRDCSFDDTCPSTFRCADGIDLSGNSAPKQCQPTSGTCACIASTAGQMMPCEVNNSFGTCLGSITCTPPMGWGACSARTPVAELCNGRDDDCDGMTDEEIPDTTCGVGACARTVAACTNGRTNTCLPGMPDLEVCNRLDDNCDGRVDENFNLQTDLGNCGTCNRTCTFTNAVPKCDTGNCAIDRCIAGWVNLDGVLANGCEHPCTPSNNGVEICDGLDNDCDGPVDEDFALETNVANCGRCGRACSFPNATPSCTVGVCGFDPMTDCAAGFSDFNGNQLDGCEYPCIVSNGGVESCDGRDNDCNGTVDGATTDAGGTCNRAPGGVARGICTDAGTRTCIASVLVCIGAQVPRAETCNGVDDDCDGMMDETPVDVGRVCSPSAGVCTAGLSTCAVGVLGCERAIDPSPELCNGLDDDCDGSVDELPTDPTLGSTCGMATGACSTGTIVCDPLGTLICSGGVAARAETCNGIDDDCDGATDNDPIDDGGSCGSGIGACVEGSQICSGGALTCVGSIGAGTESCNGIDDDCDGATDEGAAGGPLTRSCYTGASMTAGVGLCVAGTQTCTAGVFGACGGQTLPVPETCDTRDQDCDGMTDEGLSQTCYTGLPAATAGVGVCRSGTRGCVAGAFGGACTGQTVPGTESCNGLDDDCDNATDEAAAGGPLTQSCYSGLPAATAGVGTCRAGTQTCAFASFGGCAGQIVPVTDRCGDMLDTDCDALGDVAEGCVAAGAEFRLDGGGGGGNESALGAFHSYDVRLAYGGAVSGTNIYAVWSDLRNGAADVFLRRSTDGGVTWQNIQSLTTGTAAPAVVPMIAVAYDAVLMSDRVVVAWQEVVGGNRQIFLVRSVNAGATFAAPTSGARMDSGGAIDAFHHDLAVSADGEHISLVWEQLATATLARNVFSRRSIDFGVNFGTAQRVTVNSGATPQAGRPTTVVTGADRFVFIWREARAGRRTFDVFANWSDGLSTATVGAAEVRLDNDTGDNRQSDLPEAVVAGNNVYVAWEDVATGTGGGSDIVFARSTTNGASYLAEQIIDDPSGEVSSSRDVTIDVDPVSAASATDDRVFLAWEDTREGSQIYYARSTNAGAVFAAPRRASSSADLAVTGVTRDPALAFVGGDTVLIGYTNDRLGVAHAYAAASIDVGTTWQVTDPRLDIGVGQAVTPAVVRALNGGLVAWIDFRTGARINGDAYIVRVGR